MILGEPAAAGSLPLEMNMAIGEVTSVRPEAVRDPLTGATVERLTPRGAHWWMPYFNQSLIDGNRLLVGSEVSGTVQLHLLDLVSGELRQLTAETEGIGRHSATLLPGRGQVCYWAGKDLCRVDLETGERVELWRLPDGFGASILSPTADGSTVTFAACEVLETAIAAPLRNQYANMREKLYRRPSCLIWRIDTTTGDPQVVWGEREWISHVLVSPTEPDLVLFCHEGPWDLVQRLWLVSAATGVCKPVLADTPHLSRVGHELFDDQGRIVVQVSRRMTPKAKDWIHYNCVTDVHEVDPRYYRFPANMPSHIQSNHACDLWVGDRGFTQAGDEHGNACLAILRHLETERVEVTPLCRHDTSWQTQMSHPHPVFTPDDRHILFNAERDLENAVYRVAVPE